MRHRVDRPASTGDEGSASLDCVVDRLLAYIVATGLTAYVLTGPRWRLGLDAASRFGEPARCRRSCAAGGGGTRRAQIPAGLLLDRFGSKVMILSGGALMVVGWRWRSPSRCPPPSGACGGGLGDAFTFISVLAGSALVLPARFRSSPS